MMGKLFLAIELPSELREALAVLALPNGTRRVPAERMHLTVRFIGNADADIRRRLVTAVEGFAGSQPSISISGAGAFPSSRRARVLWAGVQRSAGLDKLQTDAEILCRSAGSTEQTSAWVPHVTLARLRAPMSAHSWVRSNASLAFPSFMARHLILFESRHEKSVLRYHPQAKGTLLEPGR